MGVWMCGWVDVLLSESVGNVCVCGYGYACVDVSVCGSVARWEFG